MTGRSVTEWVGRTPDTPIPPRVKLRVFMAHGGRCYLSGRVIRPGDKWEAEHVLALTLGGENRERNLAPALVEPHKAKTRIDKKLKSEAARRAKKNLGIKSSSGRKIQSRGFDKTKTRKFSGEIVPR